MHTLPRRISESQTIPIKLKRRLSYKHHYQSQNVRPKKVLDAAKYLVTTSELFKSEGIDTWQNTVTTQAEENNEWGEFLKNDSIKKDSEKETQNIENNNNGNSGSLNSETIDNDDDDDDNWCEVDERYSGVTDTLLQDPEIAGNGDNIISFAPGEGNKP